MPQPSGEKGGQDLLRRGGDPPCGARGRLRWPRGRRIDDNETSAQATTSSPATTSSAVSAAKTVAEIQAELLADLEAGRDPEVVGEIQLSCDGSGPVGFGDVVTCTPVPFTPSGGLIQSADDTVVVVEAR